jgi:hypothetical protein
MGIFAADCQFLAQAQRRPSIGRVERRGFVDGLATFVDGRWLAAVRGSSKAL